MPLLVALAAVVLLVLAVALVRRRRGPQDLIARQIAEVDARRAQASTPRPAPQAGGAPAAVDEAELVALVRGGRKIEAIRALRAATGLGLAESKAAIEGLERGEGLRVARAAPAPPPADVASLLAAGRTIEAIKVVRAQTGMGLAEAKAAVEAMQRDGRPLPPAPPPAAAAPAGPQLEIEVMTLLAAGDEIGAIKLVRAATGLGLVESKAGVDALKARLRG